MTNEILNEIGWKPFFQQQLSDDFYSMDLSIARVTAHHGSRLVVLGENGQSVIPTQLASCVEAIAVGDWLVVDSDGRAMQRLRRQTLLSRRPPGKESKPQLIAANIDTIFIVSSCNQDFNLSRLERYLALTLQSGATPVVVLTKADLCDSPGDLRRQAEKLHRGLLVETLDARDAAQVVALKNWCRKGQTVALLGSSGVGKSTLANALGANNLTTGDIREKDGKGRHTTTSRSLHRLATGGVLLDTPGMRELQLSDCEDGVADLFDDVIAIASECRFRDCNHDGDSGCAITAAVDSGKLDKRRLTSFKKLASEQAHNARSEAERRERDRGFGRMYKSVIREKRRRRDSS